MIYSSATPAFLREIPAVEIMRQIFVQQYECQENQVDWREKGNLPPASVALSSPHDAEARYTNKRETTWVGYKVHLTETCDEQTPHLITSVTTTVATSPDNTVTEHIHQELDKKELLPSEHLVDAGYPSIDLLINSQSEYGIDLVCPMRPDNSWQARTEGAFDISGFTIDWENPNVTCPMGKTSCQWKEGTRFGQPKILVRFHKDDCQTCSSRLACTKSPNSRELTFSPQEKQMALQAARQSQHSEAFKDRYKKRAGIEGTISQAAYAKGGRRCRYRGLQKTHLQQVLTACAINLNRVVDWFSETPRAQTRRLKFAALAA